MSDPTTTLGFALVPLLVIALLVGGFMAGRQSMVPRVRAAATMFPPVTFMVEPTAELGARDELIKAQTGVIEILSTVRISEPSPFTILPATAKIPSRIEVATSSVLAVEVMQLRERVAVLEREAEYYYHLKTKHWAALKKARARIRELTPQVLLYSDFERECSFKQDYHAKARSFLERITTTQELVDAGAMRHEIKAALSGNLIEFPTTRERIAA